MTCTYYERVTDAYLSGEIEAPEWQSHVRGCPQCASKLRSETDFDLVVKHAVNEERLQTRQLEAHVRRAIHTSSVWNRPVLVFWRYGIAAIVLLGFVLTAGLAYVKIRMDRNAVCVDAVDDHQEEIVGKAPRKWRVESTEVAALSQKVVGDAEIPERMAPAGYHLVGARVCLLHGKRYMHLNYSDGNKEISLFVRHRDREKNLASRVLHWFEPEQLSAERIDAFAVGSIEKHDLALVLVSPSPLADAQRIVEAAANQL